MQSAKCSGGYHPPKHRTPKAPLGGELSKIGSSEPILTEEECEQKYLDYTYVRASSSTLDVAIPHPALNPSLRSGRATFPPGEGFGFAALGAVRTPPGASRHPPHKCGGQGARCNGGWYPPLHLHFAFCILHSALSTPHSTLHTPLRKKLPRCGWQRGRVWIYLKVLTVTFTETGLVFSVLPSGVTSR